MKSKAGCATKILGTLMSLGGMLLLSLYKGVAVTHQSCCCFLSASTSRSRQRRQEDLDAGNCSVTGKLPLLLPVAAAAKQADEEVPGPLLQHRLHVLHQHAAGRSADGDDREARIGLDHHKQAGDRHNIVFGKIYHLIDDDLYLHTHSLKTSCGY